MHSTFATYHPIINFGFFCAVIGIGIFLLHPVFLGIAMTASLVYALMLGGKGTLKFFLCFLLPMTLLITIINPIVNRQGETILFYYTATRYVTMEALIYGILMGFMLSSVILWFSCYNHIMTSDKFVYLFGKLAPAISLIFSMVMRFVPNYKMQLAKISDGQKCIGRDVSNGTAKEKVRHGIKMVSIMFTWALENAIDSADSMRSRGYGIGGRSTFSIYRFDRRDAAAALTLLAITALVLTGAAMGKCSIEMYPHIVMAQPDGMGLVTYLAYGALCFYPIVIEWKEAITWRRLQSKI